MTHDQLTTVLSDSWEAYRSEIDDNGSWRGLGESVVFSALGSLFDVLPDNVVNSALLAFLQHADDHKHRSAFMFVYDIVDMMSEGKAQWSFLGCVNARHNDSSCVSAELAH
jgi:hypothetical protein